MANLKFLTPAEPPEPFVIDDGLGSLDFIDIMHSNGLSTIEGRDPRHVCEKCLTDPGIRQAIQFFAASKRCDFCNTRFRSDKTAPVEEIAAFIMGCLLQDYDIPENTLFIDNESENGWAGQTYDADDLIQDYVHAEYVVIEALVNCVTTDRVWCRADQAVLSPSRRLEVSWESFSRYVKHRSRFMFLRDDERPRGITDSPDDSYVPAAAMLDLVGGAVHSEGLLVKLKAGTRVYRARKVDKGDGWYRTAADLGPPPESDGGPPAGRMNAAGVSVFYGALDPDTPMAEALGSNGSVSMGVFSPLRDLHVLDLTRVDTIPFRSIFENVSATARGLRLFLAALRDDVAKVSARDGREHIDYVPAQIVTEYFRRVFELPNGERLDGIIYPSTRNTGGRNVALFFDRYDIKGMHWSGDSLQFHPRLVRRYEVKARNKIVTSWTRV